MKKLIAVVVILILAAAGIAYDMTQKPAGLPEPSAPAPRAAITAQDLPDITFKTLNGAALKLRDMREPVLLIHFWATWCAPCIVEFPALMDLVREMDGKVALVAVSMDYKTDPLNAFIAKQNAGGLPVYWVHDADFSLSYQQFLISQVPETIIVNPQRQMVDKIIGEYDWAGKDIRAELTALVSGSIY